MKITVSELRQRLKQELSQTQKEFMKKTGDPQDLDEALLSVKLDAMVDAAIKRMIARQSNPDEQPHP